MNQLIKQYMAIILLWTLAIVTLMIIIYPMFAFAQEIVPEAMPSPDKFFEALQNKHWPLAIALGVTIIVWFVRYIFKDKLPKHVIPYAMLACIVLSAVSTRIIQFAGESKPWWQGLVQGLLEGVTVGFSSMGLWSAGGKAILPTVGNPPKEPTASDTH